MAASYWIALFFGNKAVGWTQVLAYIEHVKRVVSSILNRVDIGDVSLSVRTPAQQSALSTPLSDLA